MVTDSTHGVMSYRQFRLEVKASNFVDRRYPLGGGFRRHRRWRVRAMGWLAWRPVLSVSRRFGRWGVGVVLGMGGGVGHGWGWGGWHVHIDWMPTWGFASRSARLDSRVERHPADEPMFTGRDIASIAVGAVPFVGTGQSVVELVIGRDYITGEPVHRGGPR